MIKNKIPENINEYIETFPPKIQKQLKKLRKTIRKAAPDAEEVISYQMPAYKLKGILLYFAAFKDHISFFPSASGVDAFKKELTGYKTSKGTIQIPHGTELPLDLIARIVKFRVNENLEKAAAKTKKKK
jgi:uncharacterized protein YdhG (YjbR/CyaY superfamily)